jgi:hypothetical protein
MLSALLIALSVLQSGARADFVPAPTLGLARWRVVPARSTIGFDGVSSLHDFTGKTHDITGELRVDPRDPEHSAGGDVSFAAASLDNDNNGCATTNAVPRISFALDASLSARSLITRAISPRAAVSRSAASSASASAPCTRAAPRHGRRASR